MELSEKIVNKIIIELEGRSGFQLLEELRDSDKEVYDELHSSLVSIVEQELANGNQK